VGITAGSKGEVPEERPLTADIIIIIIIIDNRSHNISMPNNGKRTVHKKT